MKRFVILIVAMALTGCGTLPITTADTPTPVVVVETVLVTVVPTQESTLAPTEPAAPTATPQVIVVTATGQVSAAVGTVPPTALALEATAPMPDNPGGGVFTNLTRSGDKFSLRCQPDTLTFGVSSTNPYILNVDFYYRIQDRLSTSISGWVFGGSLESDKQGNFTIAFPASRVGADLRSHRAWFDYQFVGVNKTGDAVGRSAKIAKQVAYTIDCED